MTLASDEQIQLEMYSAALSLLGDLKLPPCRLRIRKSLTTKCFDVYDILRRRWVALTPEEWVRQHFVAYLINHLHYPITRLANEISLKLNNTSRRADTMVYDASLHPLAIIEYKASSIALSNDVLNQALRYNLVFNARAVIITNGLDGYSVIDNRVRRGVVPYDELLQILQ